MLQSVGTTVLVMVVLLASGIIAARALGVQGRGELAAVILWPAVLTSVFELGLPTAFVYLSASQPHHRRDLARNVLALTVLQSLLVCVVGIPLVLAVLNDYSSYVQTTAVGFLVVYAPLYIGVRYLSALNQGAGRIGVLNVVRMLVPLLYSTFLLVLFAVDAVSVRKFAVAYAAAWLAGAVVLFAISSQETRSGVVRPRVDWGTARRSWSVGARTYFGSLAPVDTLQLDVLLTTALLGAQEAGLYFVATSAAALVRTWGTTLGMLSLPKVAAAVSKVEAVVLMSLFVRITVLISGAFAVVLAVFAKPLLVLVYGEAYASAQLLVRILAIGMLAASVRYVLGDGLRGLGGHSLATRAEVLGWIVGGLALVVLLPAWGATGVALAVSASYATTLLAMLRFARRLGAQPSRLLLPTMADMSQGWTVLNAAVRRHEQ